MKKGFTLLELLIVIIIITILASVGFVQYGNMVERSRTSEARYTCRRIRDAEEMFIAENEAATTDIAELGIGAIPDSNCTDTHYFSYAITGDMDAYTITATRCTGDEGKPPGAAASYDIVYAIDRTSGTCEESQTGP